MRARKKVGGSARETGKGLEAFQRSCQGPFGPEETWRMASPFQEITTHVPETQAAVSVGAYSSSGSKLAIDAGSMGPRPKSFCPNNGEPFSANANANPRHALNKRMSMVFMVSTQSDSVERFTLLGDRFP